ncbi:hypothetical protein Tco_0245442 [Tanacetum coccineum]
MDTTRAQQKALDDDLVALANRLKIGKSNLRLSLNLKSKEPTLQVALDALKLTSFYKAFEITFEVLEIYMQEFWVTVSRHHSSLRFKMNGKNPPFEEEILSFIRDLGHTGEIKHLTNQAMLESEAYKTYHAYATGEKIPKPKYVKNKDDPESSPKKKSDPASEGKKLKTSAKEVALSEDEQMKLATKRSKTQFNSSHASGSGTDEGTGVTPGVPDVPTYDFESRFLGSLTDSDNDGDDFVDPKFSTHDQEGRQDEEDNEEEGSDLRVQTPSHCESTDDEESDEVTQGGNVEGEELNEETDEEEEVNELYRDVNVNLEGRDTEMTDAQQTNV